MNILRSVALLPIVLLAACSQAPTIEKDVDPSRWLQHQLDITAISEWKLTSRIGIQTEKQGVSATLHWQQLLSNYDLHLIAPLGQGSYFFNGSPNSVTMIGPDKKVYQADNAQTLMDSGLGFSVYLDGLQYWVRGIPEPNTTFSELSLDAEGRLIYMKQSGFSISILRYKELNGISLPEKLVIRGDGVQLRMVVKQWEI